MTSLSEGVTYDLHSLVMALGPSSLNLKLTSRKCLWTEFTQRLKCKNLPFGISVPGLFPLPSLQYGNDLLQKDDFLDLVLRISRSKSLPSLPLGETYLLLGS